MLYEPGALYALQSIQLSFKVLSQAELLVIRVNRSSSIGYWPFGRPFRAAKKQLSSYLPPWGVNCLESVRETTLHLGTATLNSLNFLLVMLFSLLFLVSVNALVDSGSSDYFVDSVFISRYCLPIQKIDPLLLTLIDKTINHLMNHVISLPIKFLCSYSCQTEFFVTKLEGSYPIVLGHNWLTQNNPLINWKERTMVFSKANPEDWLISPQPNSEPLNPPSPTKPPIIWHLAVNWPSEDWPLINQTISTRPWISLVNAAAFRSTCKSKRAISFQITLHPKIVTGLAAWAVEIVPEIPRLPKDYQEYRDVFNTQKAKLLSKHRPYDPAI